MFSRKITYNKPYNQKNLILTKGKSSYDKLEKEMNKAPSEYEAIKKLVDNGENDIGNIDNKISKNDLVKLIPHKKR